MIMAPKEVSQVQGTGTASASSSTEPIRPPSTPPPSSSSSTPTAPWFPYLLKLDQVHRPGHPPRRRKPHPRRRQGIHHPRAQAFHRQLPHLHRRRHRIDGTDVRQICVNAKTSYPGGAVCNAVEHLLFHKDAAPRLLKKVCEDLAAAGVEIRGDDRARAFYPQANATTPQDWDAEYLAFIVGVKVVDSMDEAIAHINDHGSHHTDAILTESTRAADAFVKAVDSASVMVNASTRFADGGEYGLGAEIGISTDKMHARGPMGATDLTTYKWIVTGAGHVR